VTWLNEISAVGDDEARTVKARKKARKNGVTASLAQAGFDLAF
jgi:hypothetical protein